MAHRISALTTQSRTMRVLVVLVLYRVGLRESKSYQSLVKCGLGRCADGEFELFVYDNSEIRSTNNVAEKLAYRYVHDARNGGLSAAYNAALEAAESTNVEWLLLLDQDTELPDGFLKRLKETIEKIAADEHVSAVVPRVNSSGIQISPSCVSWGWRLSPLPMALHGHVKGGITAINSGSVVRVSFVKALGGFDDNFRLDYLDHWFYRKVQLASHSVYVSGEVLNHDLSIDDLSKNVSNTRYDSILSGEYRFFSCCGTMGEYLIYLVRLLARFGKQISCSETRSYAKQTIKQLWVAVLAPAYFRS